MYLRTWSTLVHVSSSISGTYAMFNSVDTSHSLYAMNKSDTCVPAGTTTLPFQLLIFSTSTSLADLDNNAISPATDVILSQNTTSYWTLTGFAVNSSINLQFIDTSEIPCLLKGTKILTDVGYKLIEDIKIGDMVITHDNRIIEVIDILCQSVTHKENTQCLTIKKGFYGENNKYEVIDDLYISWGHSVLIDDIFHVAKVNPLYNFEFVTNKSYYTYYGIKTSNYLTDTIIANGIPVETWGGWMSWVKGFDWTPEQEYRIDWCKRRLKKL